MSGFAFPPPPPPPPRAAPQDDHAHSGPHAPRSGRGGGDSGRGRGRGRGTNGRGGYGRGGAANHHASQALNNQHRHSLPQKPQTARQQPCSNASPLTLPSLPAGGYINPAFAAMYSNGLSASPSVSHASFPQPFSVQPAGLPMKPNYPPSSQSTGPPSNMSRPPVCQRLPSKPRVQAAPAVPSFGFALPVVKGDGPAHKSKKRKFNQLGLTPRSDVHEDSDEEDVDEEAKASAAGGLLQFEYKGRSATLKSAADIAAWIEERRKRFPTKERILQRQKEQEEAQAARRRAQEQAEAERKPKHAEQTTPGDKRKKGGEEKRKAMEKHLLKAEKLRKKLQKAEEKVAKAAGAVSTDHEVQAVTLRDNPPKNSLGIDYASEESEHGSREAESGSPSASSSDISSDSDSEPSSDDDDGDSDTPPEEESSAKRPMRVHLPHRKAPPVTRTRPSRRDKATKRISLRDRLVEQERRREAELALQAIKCLGENGRLG